MLERRVSIMVSNLVIGLVVVALPFAAMADGKAQAKQHFENGLAMMEMEDFAGATVEFEASMIAFRTQNALYNLAMCHKAQHHYPEALNAFREVLKEFGANMDGATREEVRKNVVAINGMIANIEVYTASPGATVLLDGKKVGTTPLDGPLTVGAGEHRVRASRAGSQDAEQKVTVAAGQSEVINFALVAGGAQPATGYVAPAVAAAAPIENDPELLRVEAALGRNLKRDFIRYNRRYKGEMTFAEYEYRINRSKRNGGIVLVAAIFPLLQVAGIAFYVGLTEAGVWPAGVALLALSTMGAVTCLAVGAARWGVRQKRLRRLRPLVEEEENGLDPTAPAAPEAAVESVPPSANLGLRFAGLSPVFNSDGAPSGAGLAFQF